ncbi:serine hydrolase [Paenibacillus sp. DMB5]|uniref:serine hydrolase domain-containing protein n=1 Tax=Paenibacillus sp. DMB5 TaxID=1780103 RepID=UPI00076DCD91|nr:serine hydrolase [Paenibacillus sp. DMB5]KUP22444.1 penicillin-binding protein [Paenibacillus sp. DMB5]
MLQQQLAAAMHSEAETAGFSGSFLIKSTDSAPVAGAYGYANKADQILNRQDTRFGIASGCKLFTAIAVCQLVEQGRLTLESSVMDILERSAFPLFSNRFTVHHLLTHSSGIPDYFDEETMEDFAELWITRPMYLLRQPKDFVPMFRDLPMASEPGARFHYNNAGYILLGLLVEKLSGLTFTDYVEQHIFAKCGMKDSGYFALDALPGNTAQGYIVKEDGAWTTNIYSIPVQGGADGGAFTTAPDMLLLWEGLLQNKLLGPEMTALLLTPHIHDEKDNYYGYGVWITKRDGGVYKYHVMGYDPGVSFHSAYYPASGTTAAVLCNESRGAYRMLQAVERNLISERES